MGIKFFIQIYQKYQHISLPFQFHCTGYYAMIDSSSQTGDQKARVYSDVIPPPAVSSCIEFWYFMYGFHVDTLNIGTGIDDGVTGNFRLCFDCCLFVLLS